MKTFKSLLKVWLARNRAALKKKNEASDASSVNQLNINPLNFQKDETESDEIPGDPKLDNSTAREIARTDEELRTERDGSGERPGITVEEAYQKGVTDGRNAKIEDLFFPESATSIPHFRGNASKIVSAADFFSMAREA